jgi:hypothetical protein
LKTEEKGKIYLNVKRKNLNLIKEMEKYKKRPQFKDHEDNLIKYLYEEAGIRDWKLIAQQLPTRSHKNMS